MFIGYYHYITNGLKQFISIFKQYFSFFNIWSKEVIVNVSYRSTVNKIGRYMDASISPTSVRLLSQETEDVLRYINKVSCLINLILHY